MPNLSTFAAESEPAESDYLVGYRNTAAGGERRFLLSALRSFFSAAHREKLTADRTFYVRADGNDSNDGLANTAAGAFATVQRGIDAVAQLDTADKVCRVKVGPGTFGNVVLKDAPGSGLLYLEGDTAAPGNVILTRATAGATLLASGLARRWDVSGFKITNTATGGSSDGVSVNNSRLNLSAVEFGACYRNQVRISPAASVQFSGAITVSGGGVTFISASTNSAVLFAAAPAVAFTGTPAFSFAVVSGDQAAALYLVGAWSGAATGKRYDLTKNASADVAGGGANYIPGNVAGTTSTGGQYN